MPTMTTEYGPDTVTGTTPFSAGGAGGGLNLSGMGGLLNAIAARRAAKEEAERQALAEQRAFEMKMREQEMAMREREMRATAAARATREVPQQASRNIDKWGPGSSLMMDPRTGQWSNWTDPQAAEQFNTGKVLAGRTAIGPGRKDDWNVSSLQYANI